MSSLSPTVMMDMVSHWSVARGQPLLAFFGAWPAVCAHMLKMAPVYERGVYKYSFC